MNIIYALAALLLIGLYTAVVYWAASTRVKTKETRPNYTQEVDEKLNQNWIDISGKKYKGI